MPFTTNNIPILCSVIIQFGEFGTDALGHKFTIDHIDVPPAVGSNNTLGHKLQPEFSGQDQIGHKFNIDHIDTQDNFGHKFTASPISTRDELGHNFTIDHIDVPPAINIDNVLGHKFFTFADSQLGHTFDVPGIDVPPFPDDLGQDIGHRFDVNEINASDPMGHKFRAEVQNNIGQKFNVNEIVSSDELGHKFTVGFLDQAGELDHKFTVAVNSKDNLQHKFNIDHLDVQDSLGHKFLLSEFINTLGHKFDVSIATQGTLGQTFNVDHINTTNQLGHKFIGQPQDSIGHKFFAPINTRDEFSHTFNVDHIDTKGQLGHKFFAQPVDVLEHKFIVEIKATDILTHRFGVNGDSFSNKFAVSQPGTNILASRFGVTEDTIDQLGHVFNIPGINVGSPVGHKFAVAIEGQDEFSHSFSAIGVVLSSRFAVEQPGEDQLGHKFIGAQRAFDFLFHKFAISEISQGIPLGHKFFQPFNNVSDSLFHVFSAIGTGVLQQSLQHEFNVVLPTPNGHQLHRFQVILPSALPLDGNDFSVVAVHVGFVDQELDFKDHDQIDIIDRPIPQVGSKTIHNENSTIRHTSDLPVPFDDGIGVDRFIRFIFEHSILGSKPPETGTLGITDVPVVQFERYKNQTFGSTVHNGGDGFKVHPIEGDVHPFTFNDVDGSASFSFDVWRLTKPLNPILDHPDPRVANTNDPFPGAILEHRHGIPDDHSPFDYLPIGSELIPGPLSFDFDLGSKPYVGLIKTPIFIPATPTNTKAKGAGLELNTPEHTITRTGLIGALPDKFARGQGIFPIPFDNFNVDAYRFNDDPLCNIGSISITSPDGSDTIVNDNAIKVIANDFNIFEDSNLPGQAISQVWPIDKLTFTISFNGQQIGQEVKEGPIFPPFDPSIFESTFIVGGGLAGGESVEATVEIQLRPGAGKDGKLSNGLPRFYPPGIFDPAAPISKALCVAPYFAQTRICTISDTIIVKAILRLPHLCPIQLEAPNKFGEILLLKEVTNNDINGIILQVKGDKLFDLLNQQIQGTVIQGNKTQIEDGITNASLQADNSLSRNSKITIKPCAKNVPAKIVLVDDDV